MAKLRLLHLEDSSTDAFLVRNALDEGGIPVEIVHAASRAEFLYRIKASKLDAVLVDSGVPDISSRQAIEIAHAQDPATPVIVVSNSASPKQVNDMLAAGAADYILKGHWWQLIGALRRTNPACATPACATPAVARHTGLERLVRAVQELSRAHDLPAITEAVKRAAQELTGSDGATIALREGEECVYADEAGIAPLWKGKRFPMGQSISGWAMLHRMPATSDDLENDPRASAEGARASFAKCGLVVPIRADSPIGAIGSFWAAKHAVTGEEVELLQALANITAVAMENAQVYEELEGRVRNRALQLEAANRELEAFSYSVAHDLRGPLHAVAGFADLIAMKLENSGDRELLDFLREIRGGVDRMTGLIDDLLRLAKISRAELAPEHVDVSAITTQLLHRFALKDAARHVDVRVQPGLRARADEGMLRIVLENLLGNAWKYTSRRAVAIVEVGALASGDGERVFFVRDNGAGFDPQFSEKLFAPFQRLHRQEEFEGTGVGLATVQRIIHRHSGRVWAEGAVNRGATFYFSLPITGGA